MLILSRVCADFHDKTGKVVFSVTPQTRLTFQEAPESICDDPLFLMLLADRSIEVSDNGPRRKQLENDPNAEITLTDKPAQSPGRPKKT